MCVDGSIFERWLASFAKQQLDETDMAEIQAILDDAPEIRYARDSHLWAHSLAARIWAHSLAGRILVYFWSISGRILVYFWPISKVSLPNF